MRIGPCSPIIRMCLGGMLAKPTLRFPKGQVAHNAAAGGWGCKHNRQTNKVRRTRNLSSNGIHSYVTVATIPASPRALLKQL
jgi:hypothetical protein